MGKWLHFVPENIPVVQAQNVFMFVFLFLFSLISLISVFVLSVYAKVVLPFCPVIFVGFLLFGYGDYHFR